MSFKPSHHFLCVTGSATQHHQKQYTQQDLIFTRLGGQWPLQKPRASLQSKASPPRFGQSCEKRIMDAMLPCHQQDDSRACASAPTAAPKSPRPARYV
ncbi:hypothetical protein QBC32DRAFT_332837, partial [Pseudoneurospora amorphoporcata]